MTIRSKQMSVASLIIPLLLVAALIAGLTLVKTNQETRRGAYFASTKMLLQPESSTKRVGEEIPFALYVETPAKVDFVKAKICYTNLISLDGSDLDSKIVVNREAFDVAVLTKVGESTIPEQKCLTMSIKSEKAAENLKSGLVQVALIKFKALAKGNGNLVIDKASSQVGGHNAGKTDKSIKIEEVAGASFTITEGVTGECGWCGLDCIRKAAGMNCIDVAPPVGQRCVEVDGNCVAQPISTGGDSVLNYKILFGGLQSDAKCVANWPVSITVLANGVSKTYSHTPVRDGDSFSGSLVLTGFTAREGVAVFIKGSKHLQMKYGKDNQVGAYAKAGGEISLTDSVSTSPWYVFSGYPLVAGDVTGVNSDAQDGWINGVDFSYVKQRSLTHEMVAEGAYLQADLDGNCQVNSNDVNVLKISLNEKQGELY